MHFLKEDDAEAGIIRCRIDAEIARYPKAVFSSSPMVGQVVSPPMVVGRKCWLLFLCFYRTGSDYHHLARRFGITGASQFPIQYLLATKRFNPIALALGTSHDRISRWHRALGWVSSSFLAAHGLLYLNFYIQVGGLGAALFRPVPVLGMLALSSMTLLGSTSTVFVRRHAYRVFYFTHVMLVMAIPILAWFHSHRGYGRLFVAESLGVFVFQRIVRNLGVKTLRATLTKIPGTNLIKIVAQAPPQLTEQLQQAVGSHASSTPVRLLWAVREASELMWAKNILRDPASEAADKSKSPQQPDDISSILAENESKKGPIEVDEMFGESSDERVAVVACGPATIVDDVRAAVGFWVEKGRDVYFDKANFSLMSNDAELTSTKECIISGCTVADGDALAANNLPAFWDDPHFRLNWTDRTLEYHVIQIAKRFPNNLLTGRETRRHLKAVHRDTGRIVGYVRWILPAEFDPSFWTEAVTPAVSEDDEVFFRRLASMADWDTGDTTYEPISPVQKAENEILSKKAYIQLDYLAVHPDYQDRGIGTQLVASGLKEAQKIGLDVYVRAFRPGVGLYRRLGFRIEKEIVLDDSEEGGPGEVYRALMTYAVA
ncbi:hypothetical protein O9K51_08672 [Purpureocillium lavendulum]|uniref:N-acetyltransferase domain-containing protein n=1 Tax=Purpureocillium lavendulum TaxID=1247861 RepID=A0AB34FFX0_9HYPO|nr:hypothetical protein O9K51_08672 [Purpureocillium lavendulum]